MSTNQKETLHHLIQQKNRRIDELEQKTRKLERRRQQCGSSTSHEFQDLDKQVFSNYDSIKELKIDIQELEKELREIAFNEVRSINVNESKSEPLQLQFKADGSKFTLTLTDGTQFTCAHSISKTSNKPIIATYEKIHRWQIYGEPEWKFTYAVSLLREGKYAMHLTWSDDGEVEAIPWIDYAPSSAFIGKGMVEPSSTVMTYLPQLVQSLKGILPLKLN